MLPFDSSGKGQDGVGSKTEKTLGDFAAEYAKSNRSTCKGCMEKIEKVVIRSSDIGLYGVFTLDVIGDLKRKDKMDFTCCLNTSG